MTNVLIKLHNKDIYITVNSEHLLKYRDLFFSENIQFEEFFSDVPLDKLPIDIQNKVKNILKVFSEANVTYENGQFKASTSYGIKSQYPKDHFVCGCYKATDVYSYEERKQNFYEVFGCYPSYFK